MHENTKAGLLRAETFINEYGDDMPDMNVEIHNGQASFHLHLQSVRDLTKTHYALGSPTWQVAGTDTSAETVVDGIPVTIYYSAIRDEPDAQGALRQYGLVKGLALVEGGQA